jgi:predicted transcriptional regulator
MAESGRTEFGKTPQILLAVLRSWHQHFRSNTPLSVFLVFSWLSCYGPARQKEIATDLKLAKSTVSRTLIDLQAGGWVKEVQGEWSVTQKWDNARHEFWHELTGLTRERQTTRGRRSR